jgi:hypothetical protein
MVRYSCYTSAMKKLIAIGLLAVGGCNPYNVTPDEKRWSSLSGDEVYVVSGQSMIVHANKACPGLANPKGDVLKATVKSGRLVDANGLFLNSEREKPPLCPQCVP